MSRPHPPAPPGREHDEPRVVGGGEQREEARVDVRVDPELALRRRLVTRQPHTEQRGGEAGREVVCGG